MAVEAVQHCRRLRGGSQAQLMRCSDGNFYVVKFKNNPQHPRVLANEMLATELARAIGLPVPRTEVIEVSEWLIDRISELRVDLRSGSEKFLPGAHFGSLHVRPHGPVLDDLPSTHLSWLTGFFLGMLVFDKWTGNIDRRQAVFWTHTPRGVYAVTFIDQGYCFNGGDWTFPDHPLLGAFPRTEVYEQSRGWESFEPWLSRVENLREDLVWKITERIPSEWYGNSGDLARLIGELMARRPLVRALIEAFRNSARRPFPLWTSGPGANSAESDVIDRRSAVRPPLFSGTAFRG